MSRMRGVVSAICQVISRERCRRDLSESDPRHQELVDFVLNEQSRMPDYMKLPFATMIWLFDKSGLIAAGAPFRCQSYEHRWRHVRRWSESRCGTLRDFIFFYETFVVFFWYTQLDE